MASSSNLQAWFPHTKAPFIANAPMFGFADYRLAAAVTKAGGLGFIGGGFDFRTEATQLAQLDNQLAKFRSELGDTPVTGNLPVGVGFITFTPAGFAENAIAVLKRHQVAAIWLSFPESDADHLPLIQALQQAKDQWSPRIFVQVGTVHSAVEAVKQGADVVVVQGTDAGGHQWAQGASLISLLPEVRDTLTASGDIKKTAILAAGGIVDSRGIVAAIGLGADGAVMGTRFVATAECPAPPEIKQAIVSTSDGAVSTIKSIQHDVYQSTDVFPRQYDGRAVVGISYNESRNGATDEELIQRYKDAISKGENHRRTVWAGASIGVIKKVETVADLLDRIRQDLKLTTERIQALI